MAILMAVIIGPFIISQSIISRSIIDIRNTVIGNVGIIMIPITARAIAITDATIGIIGK
jgi:hypothetical protein